MSLQTDDEVGKNLFVTKTYAAGNGIKDIIHDTCNRLANQGRIGITIPFVLILTGTDVYTGICMVFDVNNYHGIITSTSLNGYLMGFRSGGNDRMHLCKCTGTIS